MANSPMSSTASASASAATDDQPPCKKKKKQSKEPISDPSLPYDLVVSCLARVPRLYYPNLSLVSKSFRSILTSPELYRIRTLIGRTDTFLYVCLRSPEEANPRWFTLYRKPNQTLTNQTSEKKTKKKDSSCCLLAPVTVLNSPPMEGSGFIAVGCNIYNINAAIEDSPCSNVWFLDFRTQIWLEAPRMRMTHTNGEFDGKMYLAGSSEKPESLNCVEVYNTKSQTWNPVPPEKRILKLENMEGKIYPKFNSLLNWKGMAFEPKHVTGELVGLGPTPACLIENTTFVYDGLFYWKALDSNTAVWRNLEGLEGLRKFANYSSVNLANYGGKLVVLWDKYLRASGYKEKMIWCAEISLEKRNGEHIWGKVEWLDAVLKVPKSYKIVCAIAVTL